MMGTTHQHVGVAAAVGLSAACGLPWSGAAVVVVCAAKAARTPDSSEKRFRVPHRGPTHYVLSCLAMAILPVVFLVAVAVFVGGLLQYGWNPPRFDDVFAHIPVVMHQVDAVARGHHWHGSLSEFVTGAALIVGFLAVLGRCCGMVMHTTADACTPHGSPLWGPFDREPAFDEKGNPILNERGEQETRVRCRHLLPYWARVKTDSVDDTLVGWWAMGLTFLVVYLTLYGLVLPVPLKA